MPICASILRKALAGEISIVPILIGPFCYGLKHVGIMVDYFNFLVAVDRTPVRHPFRSVFQFQSYTRVYKALPIFIKYQGWHRVAIFSETYQLVQIIEKTLSQDLKSNNISIKIVAQDTVKSPKEILAVCQAANSNPNCVGLILWMHTFSPAKMWIAGLSALSKPYMHLHTQFNAELPFAEINMHFMNLNQSAHGDPEFGHVRTRLRQERKVVGGHWATESVQKQIDSWCRVAMGWYASQNLKVARFGDNMRQVAVTDGDKVAAQIKFGYEVHAYGLGDLQKVVDAVTDEQVAAKIEIYKKGVSKVFSCIAYHWSHGNLYFLCK